MNVLKNWWLQITIVLLAILDLGFEVVNPLIAALGVPDKWIVILKAAFGIYALVKSKAQLPSKNADKLQKMVDDEFIGKRPNER